MYSDVGYQALHMAIDLAAVCWVINIANAILYTYTLYVAIFRALQSCAKRGHNGYLGKNTADSLGRQSGYAGIRLFT